MKYSVSVKEKLCGALARMLRDDDLVLLVLDQNVRFWRKNLVILMKFDEMFI